MLINCPKCGKWVFTSDGKCPSCGCPRDAWTPERAKLPAPSEEERFFVMGAWAGEPIEWRVLSVGEDHLYAVSVCGLDMVRYNDDYSKETAWETSDLKAWLTQTFLPQAFSADERARIDEVTCLSCLEAEMLFANNRDRLCPPTEYAVSKGVYRHEDAYLDDSLFRKGTGACHWWLRDPATPNMKGDPCAAEVGVEGLVFEIGWPVDSKLTAVRPALWLKK